LVFFCYKFYREVYAVIQSSFWITVIVLIYNIITLRYYGCAKSYTLSTSLLVACYGGSYIHTHTRRSLKQHPLGKGFLFFLCQFILHACDWCSSNLPMVRIGKERIFFGGMWDNVVVITCNLVHCFLHSFWSVLGYMEVYMPSCGCVLYLDYIWGYVGMIRGNLKYSLWSCILSVSYEWRTWQLMTPCFFGLMFSPGQCFGVIMVKSLKIWCYLF